LVVFRRINQGLMADAGKEVYTSVWYRDLGYKGPKRCNTLPQEPKGFL